jgi:hypothetical protein
VLTTAPWLRYFALALVLATSSPAGAADVAVRYLVERDPLRLLPSTAPLVLELHADPLCSALVASQTVSLANVERIVDIKRLRLHGARTARRVLELRHYAESRIMPRTARFGLSRWANSRGGS